MPAEINPQVLLQLKLESLYQWITNNKLLLSQTDKLKITLNIKGTHVIGEITQYPQN